MAQVRIQQNFAPLYFGQYLVLWGKNYRVNSEYRDAFENTLRTARGSINRKLIFVHQQISDVFSPGTFAVRLSVLAGDSAIFADLAPYLL